MESARIERMLFIPGIFLPSRLDGKEIDRYSSTNRGYFSFVYWTVVDSSFFLNFFSVDSDSDIELRISSLGLTLAQLPLQTSAFKDRK